MKNKFRHVVLVFPILILCLNSCASATAPVQATLPPSPTETALPTTTNTPVPPSETPIPPTATIPVPDLLNEYLENPQVIFLDDFNASLNVDTWGVSSGVSVNDGGLVLKSINGGQEIVIGNRPNKEGMAITLNFTYTKNSSFEMELVSGEPGSNSYKQFAVFVKQNQASVVYALAGRVAQTGYFSGNLSLKSDTVYSLLMTILPDGEFMGIIWDPNDISQKISHRQLIGEDWANQDWEVKLLVFNDSNVIFDDYKELIFDQVK